MDEKKPKENGMEKLAAFIVDKRNLIFLLYVFALIFSIVAMDWVNVENDITTYLGEDTETRQGLTVMNDNFTTFGPDHDFKHHLRQGRSIGGSD